MVLMVKTRATIVSLIGETRTIYGFVEKRDKSRLAMVKDVAFIAMSLSDNIEIETFIQQR
jgi:hypothetical protein